jgi:hypothetical protein
VFPPSLKLLTDLISLLTLNVAGSLILLYLLKVCCAALLACLVFECRRTRLECSSTPAVCALNDVCGFWQMLASPAAFRKDFDQPDTCALLCTMDMALMSMSWVIFHCPASPPPRLLASSPLEPTPTRACTIFSEPAAMWPPGNAAVVLSLMD